MKNAPLKKGSAAGRQSKLRPDAKATAKPKKHRAKSKQGPTHTLKYSQLPYRGLFKAAQDGILIVDTLTGAMDKVKLDRIAI